MMISTDYSFAEKAEYEKEALGFNIIYNPMMAYQDIIKSQHLRTLSALETQKEIEVLAYIKKIKTIKTKQSKTMAFVELDDGMIQIEATIFNEVYTKYTDLLTNEIRIFRIKENIYKNKKSFVIESVRIV